MDIEILITFILAALNMAKYAGFGGGLCEVAKGNGAE